MIFVKLFLIFGGFVGVEGIKLSGRSEVIKIRSIFFNELTSQTRV